MSEELHRRAQAAEGELKRTREKLLIETSLRETYQRNEAALAARVRALEAQDEVHWKTRRTLLRQADALAPFVQHLRTCAWHDWPVRPPCTCGLDTARATVSTNDGTASTVDGAP